MMRKKIPLPETERDQAEIASIRAMLANHNARNRADCIAIGERLHRHLERTRLPRGETQRYVKAFFEVDADYIRPVFAVLRQTVRIWPLSQWFTMDRFGACA
jgi:hypothetical protein